MLYQINNNEGNSVGIIQTDASEDVVTRNWTKVWGDDYTEDERKYIEEYCGASGEQGIEELEAILDLRGHKDAERIFLEYINL